LLGGLDLEEYLNRVLRATTTKKGQLFWWKKCTPQTKSWLRLCNTVYTAIKKD